MTESSSRFEALCLRYAQSLASKRSALDDAWRAFVDEPLEPARRELHEQVHRLVGSAPSYGYETIGRDARAVDACLREREDTPLASREDGAELVARLAAPIRDLLQSLADGAEEASRRASGAD